MYLCNVVSNNLSNKPCICRCETSHDHKQLTDVVSVVGACAVAAMHSERYSRCSVSHQGYQKRCHSNWHKQVRVDLATVSDIVDGRIATDLAALV